MEEVANTAEAYYSRLSPAEKKKAGDIFRSMDANGDDGDGSLDFHEFLSLHYLVLTSRLGTCNGCGVLLTGVYFTCSQCFHTPTTYELCFSCYKNSNAIANHHHSADAFLDNYAMLLVDRQIVLKLQKKGKG